MATKKEGQLKKMLPGIVVGLGYGVALCIAFLNTIDVKSLKEMEPGEFAISYAALIAAIALAYFLQMAIHEGGHLVFGLATGYRFSSYRVGRFMLVKAGGRLQLKRLSIPGTAGQCLLEPPGELGEPFPYKLYNLGGIIANLVTALVCLLLLPLVKTHTFAAGFLSGMASIGILLALMNGIPTMALGVPNDGWNTRHLGAEELGLASFWIQLAVNARQAEGDRLKDMPDEWFVMPTDEQKGGVFAAELGIFAENRLMDEHDYEGAERALELLLSDESGLLDMFVPPLVCDQVFCDLLRRGKDADLAPLEDTEMQALLKQFADMPSMLRTNYAVELLAHGDADRAAAIRSKFDKIAASYPAPGEIECEREHMALIDEIVASQAV